MSEQTETAFVAPKRFVPLLIQHEKGIMFIQKSNSQKVMINRKKPYSAPTQRDYDHLLALITADPHCGIVEEGKQQMPNEQRAVTKELTEALDRARTAEAELAELKEEQRKTAAALAE